MTAPTGTRESYRDTLYDLVRTDPRVCVVDTDTGLFDPARAGSATGRYVNVGIAEHTAVGVAAGLAARGFVPYVTTMAAFVGRCLEAFKLDVTYGGLPVRLVGTHGGLSAGHLGPTHHGLEDLALVRALPAMTVVVPADGPGTARAVRESAHLDGPLYLRVGRRPTPPLPGPAPSIGAVQRLRAGREVVLLCCGPDPVHQALAAAGDLAAAGIDAGVVNVPTVAPLDRPALRAVLAEARLAVCVEEHWPSGGLSSAVAEELAATGGPPLLALGVPHDFSRLAGDHHDLLARAGLHAGAITERILARLHATPAGSPSVKEESHGCRMSRV